MLSTVDTGSVERQEGFGCRQSTRGVWRDSKALAVDSRHGECGETGRLWLWFQLPKITLMDARTVDTGCGETGRLWLSTVDTGCGETARLWLSTVDTESVERQEGFGFGFSCLK